MLEKQVGREEGGELEREGCCVRKGPAVACESSVLGNRTSALGCAKLCPVLNGKLRAGRAGSVSFTSGTCRAQARAPSRRREWTPGAVAVKRGAGASFPSPPGREASDPVWSSVRVSSAPSAPDLARGVRGEELEWKNSFLFQERARKIFVSIIKGEI